MLKPEENGTPKGGSPLALAESLRLKDMFKTIPRKDKDMVFGDNLIEMQGENNGWVCERCVVFRACYCPIPISWLFPN